MARGWESKAVEDQIEEKSRRASSHPTKSVEQLEREQRLASLNLSRSRLLQQLETARHPAHRATLQNGLRSLEQEIESLNENT